MFTQRGINIQAASTQIMEKSLHTAIGITVMNEE